MNDTGVADFILKSYYYYANFQNVLVVEYVVKTVNQCCIYPVFHMCMCKLEDCCIAALPSLYSFIPLPALHSHSSRGLQIYNRTPASNVTNAFGEC